MSGRSASRRRVRWGAALALGLGLSDCGGRSTRRPDPRPPTAVVSASRVTLDEAVPSIAPLPGLAGLGGTRALVNGRRAERRGAEWAFSEDVMLGWVVMTAEVDGRWVFATGGGSVFASDGFLGPLRRIGEVAAEGEWSSWSRGRFAFVAGRRLWTTDGITVSAPVELPAEVEVAAFRDASVGAAALADGRAMFTRDGGARWEPLDLGPDAAFDAAFDGDSLAVETFGAAFALDAAGRPTPRPAGAPTVREAPWNPAVEPDIARAWRRSYGRGSCQPALQLGNGSCLGSTARWRSRERSRGDFLSAMFEPSSFLPDDEEGRALRFGSPMRAVRWGRGAALVGDDGLFRTDDGTALEEVPVPRGDTLLSADGRGFITSDDGVHAAMRGPCVAVSRDDRRNSYCVLLDGHGRWRDLAASDELHWELVGMHDDLLLLHRVGDGRAWARVVSVETGRAQDLVFDPALGELGSFELRWLPDGSLVGVGAHGDAPLLLLLGRPGAPLSGLALPDGATGVSFADACRGYAWGRELDALWRTEDGGRHWDRLPVPSARGVARAVSQPPVTTCGSDRCVAGPWVVEGWGPVRPERPFVFGEVARPPAPAPRSWWIAPVELRCARGEARGRSRRGDPVEADDLGGAPQSYFGQWTVGDWRIAWRVAGQRRGPLDVPTGTVSGASTRGLLVETHTPPALTWVTLDGARRRVAPSHATMFRPNTVLRFAPLPDGGLVALVEAGPRDVHGGSARVPREPVSVLRLDAAGAVVAARTVAPRRANAAGLARHLGRWGVTFPTSDGGPDFVPLGGARYSPEPLPALGAALPPACEPSPAEDATVVRLGPRDLTVQTDGAAPEVYSSARVDVALRAGAWCTRSVAITEDGNVYAPVRDHLRVAAAGDGLRGELAHDGERRALRCAVVPQD